jgi:hypothetical protein
MHLARAYDFDSGGGGEQSELGRVGGEYKHIEPGHCLYLLKINRLTRAGWRCLSMRWIL